MTKVVAKYRLPSGEAEVINPTLVNYGAWYGTTWLFAFQIGPSFVDEGGSYDAVIDLDYTITLGDKWEVELAITGTEEDDYYGDTVWEALNETI